MITSYKKVKEDVLKYYDDFLDIVDKVNMSPDDTSLKALAAQANNIKEDKFCLMIAGEAKSGKSTFINAYLGTEILPMDVKQCTSSVIEICYGQEFRLNATYADGRTKQVEGETNIKKFLDQNAALDDEYRDIPITTINNEIIVKYKDKKIPEVIKKDLVKGVKEENIYRLSEEDYNNKILKYIKVKQPKWRAIVVKICIEYPFEDKNMRGIRIIDSPGVNAAGKVGDVTDKYIESADAIMFLRPITGVAIEANSFKEFLESKSVDRNKNAMFLVLTRSASESEDTIERAYEEFVNIFGTNKMDTRHGIVKDQIIPIDSKAQIYFNKFYNMSTEEIKAEIKELSSKKKAEPFLKSSWFDADGEKEAFLEQLKKYSNFISIEQSLNRFGRKAQFIGLSEFLGRMIKVYEKIEANLKDNIKSYSLKVEDPKKFAKKIKETEETLRDIENKMYTAVDEISKKYCGSGKKSIINQKAEEAMIQYSNEIEEIKGTTNSSLEELEKISYRQVDKLINFEEELQKKIVDECNEVLVTLSDKGSLKFITLKPDFSKEIVNQIKESMKDEAEETYTYTTGKTFSKTQTSSRFSQDRYYTLVRKSIKDRMELIKNDAIRDLRSFVRGTLEAYRVELSKNAEAKKEELYKIEAEKKTAEEIQVTIKSLNEILNSIEPQKARIKSLKWGIDGNVQ